MPKFILRKKYLLLVAVLSFTCFGFVGVKQADAACVINSFALRPHGVQPTNLGTPPTVNDFPGPNNPNRNQNNGYPVPGYSSSNPNFPPYVYADISTSDCDGKTFSFVVQDWQLATALAAAQAYSGPEGSIFAWLVDTFTDDEAFSVIMQVFVGPAAPQQGSPYQTDQDNFTIVFKSGEDNCVSQAGYDCKYIFGLFASNVQGYIHGTSSEPALMYDCDGVCTDAWQFVQIISYQQSLASDTGGITVGPATDYFTEGYDAYLAPLPGFTVGQSSTLGGFLKALFTVLIIVAGLLAFIMIVMGAITYATTDSFSNSEHGREMMFNAILGLVLALGAWIVLNAINPNLASNLSITIPKVSTNPRFEPEASVGAGVDQITLTTTSGATVTLNNCDVDQMSQITAFGKTFKIYHGLVASIQAVEAEWLAAGGQSFYEIKTMGGYNCRRVRGTNSWSSHAFGTAVDINQDKNPFGPNLETDMPPAFVQMWTNHGWGWGGAWTSVKDAMHFSKYPSSEDGDGVVSE